MLNAWSTKDKPPTYDEFVDKFKPKKTTDDCMTPPEIYEVIKDWACAEYGINPKKTIRPFWPGADYQAASYPVGGGRAGQSAVFHPCENPSLVYGQGN